MTSFRNISGHKNAIAHLRRAILADRVSHAYLLCGDGSDDKLNLAQAFAQTLQCTTLERLLHAPALESDDAGLGARRPVRDLQDDREAISLDAVDACGKCRSCIQAADGNQPDLITWTHEKPKTFSVEDARRLVADVQIRPFSSLRKIYIVPDAHLMNVEAQNTLLKTLEEPPEYVVLLLLCDSADMMLETIRSRCVMISLESAARTMPEESLRLAMSILLNIHEWTMPEILGAVRELSVNKLMITEFLDLFTSWYRDVLYFKATGDADGILHEEYVQEIRRASAQSSYEGIQNILDALHTAGVRLKANVNFELTIELLLLSMKEN